MGTEFGECLRTLRIRAGFGLRDFAALVGIAASNVSAMEHGRRRAPADPAKLRTIADALGLVEGGGDWARLFDAAARPGSLPADVQPTVRRRLVPVLLRTIENNQLSDDEIGRLIQEIENRHDRPESEDDSDPAVYGQGY
jgi:transcriptional regulator with XRE-family HTH domain